MEFTFLEALMVGLYYFIANADFVAFPFAGVSLQDASFTGLIMGLMFGDVQTGLLVGTEIAMIYFGAIGFGGVLPNDQCVAACIVVPIAIKAGLGIESAIVLAVPFATLGAMLDNVRRLIAGYWHRQAEKHLDAMEFDKFKLDATVGPLAVSAVLRIIPVTLLLYIFGGAAGDVIALIPDWLLNGFSVIAKLLPGLGIAICVNFIGKASLLPYFVIGYYGASLLGFGSVTMAVLGTAIAFLHVQFTASQFEDEEDDDEEETPVVETKNAFTDAELYKYSYHLLFWFRVSQSIEYYYGTGIGYSLMKPLEKLYGENKEGLQKALKRHIVPFIYNQNFGGCIISAALAMEEDIAKNGDPTGEKGQAIVAMKTSLMGPITGLGDSIELPTLWPICKSIFYPMAQQGMIIGAFASHVFNFIGMMINMVSFRIGYVEGKKGLVKLLSSSKLQKILVGAGVLGMVMMGVMTSSNVAFNLALTINTEYSTVNLGDMFNGILPGMLTMAYMTAVYVATRKGTKFTTLVLIICIWGILGSLLGLC